MKKIIFLVLFLSACQAPVQQQLTYVLNSAFILTKVSTLDLEIDAAKNVIRDNRSKFTAGDWLKLVKIDTKLSEQLLLIKQIATTEVQIINISELDRIIESSLEIYLDFESIFNKYEFSAAEKRKLNTLDRNIKFLISSYNKLRADLDEKDATQQVDTALIILSLIVDIVKIVARF